MMNSPSTPRVSIAIACYLLILGITVNHVANPGPGRIRVGDVARKDFNAPASVTFEDTEATSTARQNAAANVDPVYTIDPVANYSMVQDLTTFFQKVQDSIDEYERLVEANEARDQVLSQREEQLADSGSSDSNVPDPEAVPDELQDPDEYRDEQIAELLSFLDTTAEEVPWEILYAPTYEDVRSVLVTIFSMDQPRRTAIHDLMKQAIEENISELILNNRESLEQLLSNIRASLATGSENAGISQDELRIANQIVAYFIRPNFVIDPDLTEAARQAAIDETPLVLGEVREGQIFLRSGEVVTQRHIDIIHTLGITNTTSSGYTWITILLFAAILGISFILGALHLGSRRIPELREFRYYLLFFTIVVISYLTSFFLVQQIGIRTLGTRNEILMTLATLPVIMGAVLIAHYLTRMLAVTVSGFMAIVITLASGSNMLLIPALLPSIAAGLMIRKDCPRPTLIRAIIFLPFIWIVSLMGIAYASGQDMNIIATNPWLLLFALVPTPLAMILANFILDSAFNIPTANRLQEFDNQDHPLLRKLQLEAPGTWHHSMMVGLIAEAACQAVGGNTHLVRVACMYHDIGKTRRPEFFIENQRGGGNVHDKYSPWLSKIIVESHVKDGITLAKSHGLPKELVDLIPQHHGTSLIAYFFRKALAMSDDGYVNEYDYRYPGPKPQTLEGACINIADAAESATRSIDDPTPHRIESLVNRIYEDRLLDGQFEECGLALNQLEKIKDTIIDRLIGAYHARIEYPEEEELKRQLQLKRAEADKKNNVDPQPGDE